MSAEALGWVFRRSPYEGATLAVHLAIGDSVNDQHEHEFWMTAESLAAKARVSRASAQRAVYRLRDDGFLEILDPGGGRGRATRFRFLFPDAPVVWDYRKPPHHEAVSPAETASSGGPDDAKPPHPSTRAKKTNPSKAKQPKDGPAAAAAVPPPWDGYADVEAELAEIARAFPEFPVAALTGAAWWRTIDAATADTDVYYLEELRKYAEWWSLKDPARRHRNVRRGFSNWIREEKARAEWRRRKDARKAR